MRSSTRRWSVSTVKALRSSTCYIGFDLLAGDNLRMRLLAERKSALAKLLIRSRGGIQYVEHAEGHGERMFPAVRALGLEASYRSGATRLFPTIEFYLANGKRQSNAPSPPWPGMVPLGRVTVCPVAPLRKTERISRPATA